MGRRYFSPQPTKRHGDRRKLSYLGPGRAANEDEFDVFKWQAQHVSGGRII